MAANSMAIGDYWPIKPEWWDCNDKWVPSPDTVGVRSIKLSDNLTISESEDRKSVILKIGTFEYSLSGTEWRGLLSNKDVIRIA